jgi:GTPase SAR1 family protein
MHSVYNCDAFIWKWLTLQFIGDQMSLKKKISSDDHLYLNFSFFPGKDFNKIIIVGNKIDLKHSRQVTTEDGLRKTITENMQWFTEISAKLNCNIKCLFQIILKNYVKTNDMFLGKNDKAVANQKSNNIKSRRFKKKKISAQTLAQSLYTIKDKCMISNK